MATTIKLLTSLFITVNFIMSVASAQKKDPSKIFKSLEPSVVSISDAEGGGSGIVLTADGLILTNFHVANTPLPQVVEAIVNDGGRKVKRKFTKVRLLKVHVKNDLALLKIDAPGVKFKPARISKSIRDTVAGRTCYAMGYPFVPGQDKPALTITKGIISSARRVVNGSPYIQLDAAINPGNSGGALINANGVVIGIPTLKFEGKDRIGLAAPLAGLKMKNFIKPEDRKGNPEEAARLSRLASELIFREAVAFGSNPEIVELAIYLQREALSLDPHNPVWSYKIATMYVRLKKYPLALAYLESSVSKDPNQLYSRALLADCQDLLKQPKKAMENRLACLSIPIKKENQKGRALLMNRLANTLMSNGDAVRAVYILSWAKATSSERLSASQRLVLQKARRLIPEAFITKTMAKKDGHSVRDMNKVAATFLDSSPSPVVSDKAKEAIAEKPAVTPAPSNKPVLSKVFLKPGATVKFVDGPSNVVYHESKKTLVWTPLPFSKKSTMKVLFILTKADGSEETYIHTITRK